jgi:hypothetical protein
VAGQWFVRHEGVSRGPYSSAQVRRLLLAETLSTADMVSTDGHRWQPMMTVPEVVPMQLRDEAMDSEQELYEEAGHWRRQSLAGLLLVLLVLGTVLLLTLYLDRPPAEATDCAAAPAPGIDWRDCRFAALSAAGADLQGVRLSNAALPGARLQGARLSEGDLSYTDLQAADLSYADLRGARLMGADLRGADLTYTDLSGADLSFADLRDAGLGGARLEDTRLHGALWVDGRRCGQDAVNACPASAD